jgi:putative acetyltransferase
MDMLEDMTKEVPDTEIRPARLEDAADIAAIRREDGVHENILALTSERTSDVRRFLSALCRDDRAFVAEGEDGLTGMAVLLRSTAPRRAHCASIEVMVGAESQGVGVGSALLKRLLDEADHELRLHRLELLVLADNKAALSLCRNNGFSIEARRKHAAVRNGKFADEFLMARIRAEASA